MEESCRSVSAHRNPVDERRGFSGTTQPKHEHSPNMNAAQAVVDGMSPSMPFHGEL